MLWGSNGASAANSPMHTSDQYRGNTGNQTNAFMNTNPGAFGGGAKMVYGVYGVTNTQVIASEVNSTPFTGNSAHTHRFLSPGWYVTRQWMGPVNNFIVVTNGGSYQNTDTIHLTSAYTANATVNTGANLITNATGNIVGFGPLCNSGGMFVNSTSATLTITTSTGSGATVNATLGGRAGRVGRECLISLGSMTSNTNSANNPLFPNI
jgi:hypothetical protein